MSETPSVPAPEAENAAPDNTVPATEALVRQTTELMERARAALEAAEAEFAIAEQEAERAAIADQMRRDREEDERIADLIANTPVMEAAVEVDLNDFRLAVANLRAGKSTMESVMRAWLQAATTREYARRFLEQISAHAGKRSTEHMAHWERKSEEWAKLLVAVAPRTSVEGIVSNQPELADNLDDDALEALAKVNEKITEESQSAPRPLARDPRDTSIPGPFKLGVVGYGDLLLTQRHSARYQPRDFSVEFDGALAQAVQAEVDEYVPATSPRGRTNHPTVAEARASRDAASARIAELRERGEIRTVFL